MNETHRRSLAKALSWRVIAMLITMIVTGLITGRIDTAISVGLIDTVIKLGAYYSHERLWLRISFGRLPPSDYQI